MLETYAYVFISPVIYNYAYMDDTHMVKLASYMYVMVYFYVG